MKFQINLTLPLAVLLTLVSALALLGFFAPDLLSQPLWAVGMATAIALNGIWISWVGHRAYVKPSEQLLKISQSIAHGRPIGNQTLELKGPAAETGRSMASISKMLRDAAAFAHEIGEGNYEVEHFLPSQDQSLGKALLGMRTKLKDLAEEEGRRNWMVAGYAEFSDLIQQLQGDFAAFGNRFVSELCRYMEVELGAVYLREEEAPDHLRRVGAYGLQHSDASSVRFSVAGSLLGQVMLEEKARLVDNLPEDYLRAQSGLGGQTPRYLLLSPIHAGGENYGAIELASFHPIPAHRLEWMEKVSHDLGVKVGRLLNNARTQELLHRTQATNARMKEQEEALQAAQSEREQQLTRLENEMAWSSSLTQAIDRTNASLTLDPQGRILGANQMYTALMGYSEQELVGQLEEELLSPEDLKGGQYQMMWENLASGTFFTGEFRRIRKDGDVVWFSGSYSPVFDGEGKVIRVVKFARVVSEEKEFALVVKSQLRALAAGVPSFFLTAKDSLLAPNAAFAQISGFSRKALKTLEFSKLLYGGSYLPQQWQQDRERVFQRGEVLDQELELSLSEGEQKKFRAVISPVQQLSGRIEKSYVILLPSEPTVAVHKDLSIHIEPIQEL